MTIQKNRLRSMLRQQRAGFSVEDVRVKSRAIVDQLKVAVDWSELTHTHCYRSAEREVATDQLIDWLQARGMGLSVPDQKATLPADSEVEAAYDIIIVPMLGFDASLHRLGYGGGYYDRLLAAHPQALKVGMCFEAGLVDRLPREPHDQKLDMIITEHRVYRG